jgi:hypothetical protein
MAVITTLPAKDTFPESKEQSFSQWLGEDVG